MARPNLAGTLHLDLEQDVLTRGEVVHHRLTKGPVSAAVVLGPFQKISGFEQSLKLIRLKKPIVDPMGLAGAGLSGRRRD
jgi:hypothetical protein